jgi:hypothetical protein
VLWNQIDAGNRLVPADHRLPTDDEMRQRAVRVFIRTWQAIGADVLEVYYTLEGRDSITQGEAHDAILSAGIGEGFPGMHGGDGSACLWLDAQTEAEVYRLLELALPFATYGGEEV